MQSQLAVFQYVQSTSSYLIPFASRPKRLDLRSYLAAFATVQSSGGHISDTTLWLGRTVVNSCPLVSLEREHVGGESRNTRRSFAFLLRVILPHASRRAFSQSAATEHSHRVLPQITPAERSHSTPTEDSRRALPQSTPTERSHRAEHSHSVPLLDDMCIRPVVWLKKVYHLRLV